MTTLIDDFNKLLAETTKLLQDTNDQTASLLDIYRMIEGHRTSESWGNLEALQGLLHDIQDTIKAVLDDSPDANLS